MKAIFIIFGIIPTRLIIVCTWIMRIAFCFYGITYMAKRFTDTEKWKDSWFNDLPPDIKLGWIYLVDNCDHAGVWKINYKLLKFFCDINRSDKEIKKFFKNRIYEFDNKWFILNFLKFQYPNGLNGGKPALISVRKLLKKYNLITTVKESLGNDYITIV